MVSQSCSIDHVCMVSGEQCAYPTFLDQSKKLLTLRLQNEKEDKLFLYIGSTDYLLSSGTHSIYSLLISSACGFLFTAVYLAIHVSVPV